jgi:predicted cation transporter
VAGQIQYYLNEKSAKEYSEMFPQLLMAHIPDEPVLPIVIGLCLIVLLVLILPFVTRKVEENLELFFLIMGVCAVTVAGLWSWELVIEAAKAPVVIGQVPVGIFQVVLVFGLLIHFYNKAFCRGILTIASKLGWRLFTFLLILLLGIFCSVVSIIVTAVLLSEIIAALPLRKMEKVKFAVVACFAMGMGAVLTPVGEPLSTIMVSKLAGEPYHAGFFFPLEVFGIYILPGILVIALFGAFFIGRGINLKNMSHEVTYSESLKSVILRAVKVYFFVAALVLLGEGMKPLIVWYIVHVPSWILYWINMVSAILDNATLTAMEIGPTMALPQIIGIIMGLLIAGGMLIPGNIPNIVAAARLKINMKEWALVGVPIGLVIMAVYFIIMLPLFLSAGG